MDFEPHAITDFKLPCRTRNGERPEPVLYGSLSMSRSLKWKHGPVSGMLGNGAYHPDGKKFSLYIEHTF